MMRMHEVLSLLQLRLAQALPTLAVVAVHTQDLSDANTAKWLVKLPGVYLMCERITASGSTEAVLHLRALLMVRQADLMQPAAHSGWDMAESVLAVLVDDPLTSHAALVYRDEQPLDQPGLALWEITLQRQHVLLCHE